MEQKIFTTDRKMNLLSSLMFSFFTALLMGCSGDDLLDNSETLFNIIVSEDYNPSEGDFFFLSTLDGDLIDAAEIVGSSTALKAPTDFDEEFILHRLIKNETNYLMISRVGVPSGDLFLTSSDPSTTAGNLVGFASIRFTDIPENDGYYVSPSRGGFESLTGNDTYRTSVYENRDEAYIFLRNGESVYYKILDNLKIDTDNVISLDQMDHNMDKLTIDMNGFQSDFSHVAVSKWESSFNGLRLFDSRVYPDADPSNNYEIFIPQDFGEYKNVFTYLTGPHQSNDNVEYTMSTRGTIPDRFEMIDADIVSVSADVNDLRMEANGSFDFSLRIISGISNENGLVVMQWLVYSHEERNVGFPTLPSVFLSRFPEFSAEGIESQEQVSYLFSLHEHSNLDGYDEFIGRIYPENFVSLPAIRTDLSISYDVSVSKPGRSAMPDRIVWPEVDHFKDAEIQMFRND